MSSLLYFLKYHFEHNDKIHLPKNVDGNLKSVYLEKEKVGNSTSMSLLKTFTYMSLRPKSLGTTAINIS